MHQACTTPPTAAELAGRTFRMFRQTHGLSLRVAAAGIGISGSYLSRIENGRVAPPARTYDGLVNFYATTAARRG